VTQEDHQYFCLIWALTASLLIDNNDIPRRSKLSIQNPPISHTCTPTAASTLPILMSTVQNINISELLEYELWSAAVRCPLQDLDPASIPHNTYPHRQRCFSTVGSIFIPPLSLITIDRRNMPHPLCVCNILSSKG
jgi:hypothetical protein